MKKSLSAKKRYRREEHENDVINIVLNEFNGPRPWTAGTVEEYRKKLGEYSVNHIQNLTGLKRNRIEKILRKAPKRK